MTRILVVDDHTLFRKGVAALLGTIDDAVVVGEAASGEEAVQRAQDLRPDLILLDLQMPGMDGLTALPHLRAVAPDAAILVLTMRDDDAAVLEALQRGARGYLLKDMDADDLVRAIDTVSRGDAFIGREVADRLGDLLRRRSEERPFPTLTDSELAVLRLLAGGSTNDDIARELSLSKKTVQNYVSRIFDKIGAADRAQAVVRAREAGLHLD